MTTFSKELILNQEEVDWIIEEFKNLHFNWRPSGIFDSPFYENYSSDYYWNHESYHDDESRNLTIQKIDDEIIDMIQNDEELNSEEKLNELEKFKNWIILRQKWIKNIKLYEKNYKSLGFCLDYFPNFTLEVSKTENNLYKAVLGTDYEKHEHIHNPIILAIFIQNFIQKFNRWNNICFSYIENAEESREEISYGLMKVTSKTIEMYSCDDLEKILSML